MKTRRGLQALAPYVILVSILVSSYCCAPVIKASQVRSGNISAEGYLFLDQDPVSGRWIPKMNITLNLDRASGSTLHIDLVEVRFYSILFEDGSTEKGFVLSSETNIELKPGKNQLLAALSEYGFDKKPTNMDFKLQLRIAETKETLTFESINQRTLIMITRSTTVTAVTYYTATATYHTSLTYYTTITTDHTTTYYTQPPFFGNVTVVEYVPTTIYRTTVVPSSSTVWSFKPEQMESWISDVLKEAIGIVLAAAIVAGASLIIRKHRSRKREKTDEDKTPVV